MKYYQLRHRVSIPALRSSLLDQIGVNIFFWYLLKHSQFSLAPASPQKETMKCLLSWPSNHRYVSSSHGCFLPVDCPTFSTHNHQRRAVYLSVCLGLIWIHILQTLSSCVLGENLVLQMPGLPFATVIISIFLQT